MFPINFLWFFFVGRNDEKYFYFKNRIQRNADDCLIDIFLQVYCDIYTRANVAVQVGMVLKYSNLFEEFFFV